MSVTQSCILAQIARAKLLSNLNRPNYNLRILVGHVNLLDSLIAALISAEWEQELWFRQSIRDAAFLDQSDGQYIDPATKERKHGQQSDKFASLKYLVFATIDGCYTSDILRQIASTTSS